MKKEKIDVASKPNRANRRALHQNILKKIKRLRIGKDAACAICHLHHMGPSLARCQCKCKVG